MMRARERWLSVALLVIAVGYAGCGGEESSAEKSSENTHPAAARPVADANTVYNSAATLFLRKYKDVVSKQSTLSNETQNCYGADEADTYDCEFRVDIPIFEDEAWAYEVQVEPSTGCWTATLHQPFGPYQSQIEAYQDRETLAPTKSDVRRLSRDAKALRTLGGCVSGVPENLSGTTEAARFITTLASQHVARKFPGEQRSTHCKDLGREKVALAPDSTNFDCRTKLVDGRTFADSIYCFDEPPHANYESCGHEEGFPKLPPRPLPDHVVQRASDGDRDETALVAPLGRKPASSGVEGRRSQAVGCRLSFTGATLGPDDIAQLSRWLTQTATTRSPTRSTRCSQSKVMPSTMISIKPSRALLWSSCVNTTNRSNGTHAAPKR
jgi:hypothetical protein